jgi:hypothetical protein
MTKSSLRVKAKTEILELAEKENPRLIINQL